MAIPRRYLNEIATSLRQVYDAYEEHIVYDDCPVYHAVVHHINSIFFNENPNYDPDKFLAASGYDEYTSKLSNKDPRTQLQHTLTVLVRALGSLVRSPERMYVPLQVLLEPSDGVIFLGYLDEATGKHEPCQSNSDDCNGECISWVEEKENVITVRWFGCKFYFQVWAK
jgi:hypothetical protein